MKKFLKTLVLFLLPPLAGLCLIVYLLDVKVKNELEQFRVNDGVTTLLLGDSHAKTAFNDTIIAHAQNMSCNNESLFHTCHKLKSILKGNPQIQRVVLAVGYHNLSDYYDPISFDSESARHYFMLLPRDKQLESLKGQFSIAQVIECASFQAKHFAYQDAAWWIGDYHPEHFRGTNDSIVHARIQKQYFSESTLRGTSDINLEALEEIIQLCHARKVRLILVNTPLSAAYRSELPKKFISKLTQTLAKQPIEYLDMSQLNLTEKDFIPDGDHVSYTGSVSVSDSIQRYLGGHD